MKEIKAEQQDIVGNIILPAVNDISKHVFSEPAKCRNIIKQVMDNELFRFHFWYDRTTEKEKEIKEEEN
jgi:hypothetical protein